MFLLLQIMGTIFFGPLKKIYFLVLLFCEMLFLDFGIRRC